MKKLRPILWIVLIHAVNADAQQPFFKTYHSAGEGYAARQTADGGFIAAGNCFYFASHDFHMIRTDSNGDTLWTRVWGGSSFETARDVLQTSDGGFLVAGYTQSFGAGASDVYLARTDGNGNLIWNRTYGGTDDDYGLSVAQHTDGGFVVAGHTNSFGAGNTDVFLIRVNSVGDTVWTKTLGGVFYEEATTITNAIDGGFIITGSTSSYGAGQRDAMLIKLDNNGYITWSKTFGEAGLEAGRGVVQTSDGGFIISGYKSSLWSSAPHSLLIKTDSTGSHEWTTVYSNGFITNVFGESSSVKQTSQGEYVFTIVGIPENCMIVQTDGSGGFQRSVGFANGKAHSIHHTADGGFILCGSVEIGLAGMGLVKLDAAGNGCLYGTTLMTSGPDTSLVSSFSPSAQSGCSISTPAVLTGMYADINVVCSPTYLSPMASPAPLEIFPNPSGGKFIIASPTVFPPVTVRILNAFGKHVFEKSFPCGEKIEADLRLEAGISPGIYFVGVDDGEKSFCLKLLIQ
jgi:hypothetical protein